MNPTAPDPRPEALLAAAERVANDILAPRRGEVDQSGVIPRTHLDALADAGLFGAALTTEPKVFARLVETLAQGCLSTTFVWLQHHGLARRLSLPNTSGELAELACELRAGRTRAGIVQAGLLPGAPLLTARREPHSGRWLLNGFSPWCTGWGMVDELLVAARVEAEPGTVAWFVVQAEAQSGLEVRRLPLQAVDATVTVSLRFAGVPVDASRFVGTDDYAMVGHPAGHGLRPNGSLALGLAARCAEMIESVGTPDAIDRAQRLAGRIDAVRSELDAADDTAMPVSRVDVGLLAVDAAVALVAAHGATSAIKGSEAEQAMREATFLLVFGSRPSIKQELLRRS